MGFADDYVPVADRIAQFREKHPDGCLRPQNPDRPIEIVTLGDKVYLQYVACAYRDENDTKPGIGIAWEVFPGTTSFTRNSEAMNAETSAWGRAIVAVLAADTKHIATQEEVQYRQEPAVRPEPDLTKLDEAVSLMINAIDRKTLGAAWTFAGRYRLHDAEVDGIYYRELWKQQLAIVDTFVGDEQPVEVAPAEEPYDDEKWLAGKSGKEIPVAENQGEKPKVSKKPIDRKSVV